MSNLELKMMFVYPKNGKHNSELQKVCFFLSNGDVWCVIWISHDLSLFFWFVFEKTHTS